MTNLYHVLTSIQTAGGAKYSKGTVSSLGSITSKGIRVLLDRGVITPLALPPLEVVFKVKEVEKIKAAGIKVLDDLLGRNDLESVGLEALQEEVSIISEDLGIGGS